MNRFPALQDRATETKGKWSRLGGYEEILTELGHLIDALLLVPAQQGARSIVVDAKITGLDHGQEELELFVDIRHFGRKDSAADKMLSQHSFSRKR